MNMKKFFVKNLCFCCAGGNRCGKDNEKKTAVPFQQTVAIHDIVSSANGNGAVNKQTYVNKGYKHDDLPVQSQPSLNSTKPVYFRKRQLSQLSDISEIFRLPLPDDRSLGDVMIEEYDNKSKTLHAGESGNLSDHGSRASSRAASTDDESVSLNLDVAKDRSDTSSNVSNSLNRSNSCNASQNKIKETFENTISKGSENIREPSDSNDESSDDDQSAPSLEVSFEERSLQSTCSENDAAENVETHYTKTPNVFNAVPISA